MARRPRQKWFRSRSNWVAAAFVAAAAAVAWFGDGLGSRGAHQPAAPSAVVMTDPVDPPEERVPGSLPLGGLPTRLVISKIAIDAQITEVGIVSGNGRPSWETAWRSVGHHLDSAMPGQPGNMVLTGHVSVADRGNLAIFKSLDQLVPGDSLEVFSGDQLYRYTVSQVSVVVPEALRVLRSDQTSTVTLITCTRDLKNRLVVVGTLT